jgi:hypothetical protein
MTVQKIVKLTDAQAIALETLLSKTGETFAEFVRRNAEQEAAQHNIIFPQDMLTREETIKKAYSNRWPKDA